MDDPKISILVPAYNCSKYIEQCLSSILSQTYSNFEILISDDGSSDNTRAIIDSIDDNRIKSFHNSKNRGKTFTVNSLAKRVTGSFVTIHDADDISVQNRFEKQMAAFQNSSILGMCGTSFNYVKNDLTIFQKVVMSSDYNHILKNLGESSQFHGPTMMIRKTVLDQEKEVYRPFFRDYNEDCDLAYRIAEKHYSINLEDCLYLWRIRPDSLSKKLDARKKCMYKIVAHLAKQRANTGYDDLMKGNESAVNLYLKTLMKPYDMDPSLIHREAAAFQMYFQLYKNAVKNSLRATSVKPFKFINYRTLLYCLRKWMLSIVFKNYPHSKLVS